MARVVLATLRGAGGFEKRLVVKQIRDELSFDQQFVRRFVEEAKTTVALSHPNIVPVELGDSVRQVVGLEGRIDKSVESGKAGGEFAVAEGELADIERQDAQTEHRQRHRQRFTLSAFGPGDDTNPAGASWRRKRVGINDSWTCHLPGVTAPSGPVPLAARAASSGGRAWAKLLLVMPAGRRTRAAMNSSNGWPAASRIIRPSIVTPPPE
nr:hypothetical protein [Escherichia coli]